MVGVAPAVLAPRRAPPGPAVHPPRGRPRGATAVSCTSFYHSFYHSLDTVAQSLAEDSLSCEKCPPQLGGDAWVPPALLGLDFGFWSLHRRLHRHDDHGGEREPESLIYSLGIFGSKVPKLGVFFWSLHPGTGGTRPIRPGSSRARLQSPALALAGSINK